MTSQFSNLLRNVDRRRVMKYLSRTLATAMTSVALFLMLVEAQGWGLFAVPIFCAAIALTCVGVALWRPWLAFITVSAWYIGVVSASNGVLEVHSVSMSRYVAVSKQLSQERPPIQRSSTTVPLTDSQLVWLSLAGLSAVLGLASRRKGNLEYQSWPAREIAQSHAFR